MYIRIFMFVLPYCRSSHVQKKSVGHQTNIRGSTRSIKPPATACVHIFKFFYARLKQVVATFRGCIAVCLHRVEGLQTSCYWWSIYFNSIVKTSHLIIFSGTFFCIASKRQTCFLFYHLLEPAVWYNHLSF